MDVSTSPSTLERPSRRWTLVAPVAVVIAAAGAGCTPERGETDARSGTVVSTLAVPEVTPPPERRTPFCQIMLDLDDSLPADPTIEVTDEVLVAYREALPVAPPVIADELEAVIVGLETGTEPTPAATVPTSQPTPATSVPTTPETFVPPGGADAPGATLEPPTPEEAFDEEGYLPDDDPAIRLNEYVDFACRDSVNNPGPPPTQPSATPVPLLDDDG